MPERRPARRTHLTVRRKRKLLPLLLLLLAAALLLRSVLFLRRLSGEIALSDAGDLVTMQISQTVSEMMESGELRYDSFVETSYDAAGHVRSVTANMPRINALSAELLDRLSEELSGRELSVRLPLGSLLGSELLLGRGPAVPVRIVMLTSSRAGFRNEIVSAGINQTRHQILLEIRVDIDVLIPWRTLSTQVNTEVLAAETVIVGAVPDTYLNMELKDGTE